MELQFQRYYEKAIVLLKATNGLAGYNLFSSINKLEFNSHELNSHELKSNSHELIRTDLILKIANGFYGEVFGRSGLALKYVTTAHNGVIDSDYRGVVCVILFNNSSEDYQVLCGRRIGQIIFKRSECVKSLEVSKIEKTERNTDGFGSTGG